MFAENMLSEGVFLNQVSLGESPSIIFALDGIVMNINVVNSEIQGGFFNWPPPPHARLNRAPVHGLAVHEEGGAS